MKKHQKYISYSLLGFLVLMGAFFALLSSSWTQNKIRSRIISSLAREGLQAEIQSVEGSFVPNQITLTKVHMDLPENGSLSIEQVKAKISLLYFLKNEIRLSKVKVFHLVWKSPKTSQNEKLFLPSLPMAFSIQSLKASDVHIDQMEPIELEGRLKIGAHQKGLFLHLKARRENDLFSMTLRERRNGFARWNLELAIQDSAWLKPVYQLPLQGELKLHARGTRSRKRGARGRFEGTVQLQSDLKALQLPWTVKGSLQRSLEGNWLLSHLYAETDQIKARASASLDPQGQLVETSGQLESKNLFIPYLQGELLARWMLRKEEGVLLGKTVAQIPSLQIGKFSWEKIELIADSFNEEGSFELKGEGWESKGQFAWTDRFQLKQVDLKAPQLRGHGDWEFFYDGSMTGIGELNIDNLQILKPLAPAWDPYGQLKLKTVWDSHQVTLDMTAQHLYLKSFYFEHAALYSDLQNPLDQLTGILSIDVEKGHYRDLNIDSALAETVIGGEQWPFKLFAEGVWNRDFEMHSDGFWHMDKEKTEANIRDLHGLFYSHPFSLQEPVDVAVSSDQAQVSPTWIEMDGALVKGKWFTKPDSSALSLQLADFPIDCLSINPLEVSIVGRLNLESEITEVNREIEGYFQAAISQVEISRLGETEPITAQGKLTGELRKNELVLQGDLSTRNEPLASLQAKLPIQLKMSPWQIDMLKDAPTEGKFHLDGQIEDFLDFFNLRSNWLQGRCISNFSWTNTLDHLSLDGSLELTQGYYENYLTAAQLTELRVQIEAKKNVLYLKSLTAKDREQTGTVFADGELQLNVEQKFPFHLHCAFQDFRFMDLGFASAKANSAIDITGNLEGALAQGEVHVIHSDLTIPENLTKRPPNLEVIYLNAQKPVPAPLPSAEKNYPLRLNIIIDTPKPVLISGRGLQSEWKGNFFLKGTHLDPHPTGNLELLDGEFSFSGRFFKLTRGNLTFTTEGRLTPRLDLSGTTEQQGISVIVNLQGPINNPQLTFQSVPQLPLSAIISHLLFGQDISEINGLQALQLATAVTNIAGQSPDMLESTRKSLGIDRLSIVSEPSSEGGETISIQVGKYVAKGVLVSISQSAENSAPNISIEVDIGKGFFFEAETDQLQEQGKFGIKWNRNY